LILVIIYASNFSRWRHFGNFNVTSTFFNGMLYFFNLSVIACRRFQRPIINDSYVSYFINGTLNNIKYDNFLRNNLGILLEDIQLNICRVMWYQHDRCSAHYGRRVTATLNEIFLNRWIECDGPISWLARSPSHNIARLLFIFIRGTLKIIYQEVPTTPKNMK